MHGPFKCPDCGTWWSGNEHRCRPNLNPPGITVEPYVVAPNVPSFGACCTCHGSCNHVGQHFDCGRHGGYTSPGVTWGTVLSVGSRAS